MENWGERPEGDRQATVARRAAQSTTLQKKKTCRIASHSARCYSVSTRATLEEDLIAFTQHFRKQSGDVDAVVVTFFFDKPQANSGSRASLSMFSLTSQRLAPAVGASRSESREAARNILSRSLPQERFQYAYLNEEVSRAMQNDGIYVISIEDEMRQHACEG